MPLLVLDASVVLKWVLPEPGTDAAVEILDQFESGSVDLLAPRVLLEEAASALSKRARQRELSSADALEAFRWIESRCPRLVAGDGQVLSALALSLHHQISLWDALYLALAIEHRCDLVTADRRLYRALARPYPFTHLLGHHGS